jgi:hypothetical protein
MPQLQRRHHRPARRPATVTIPPAVARPTVPRGARQLLASDGYRWGVTRRLPRWPAGVGRVAVTATRRLARSRAACSREPRLLRGSQAVTEKAEKLKYLAHCSCSAQVRMIMSTGWANPDFMSNGCGRSCYRSTQYIPSGESTIAQVDYSALRRSASQRAGAHADRRFNDL